MRISAIDQKRTKRTGMAVALLLACVMCAVLAPATGVAATGEVMLTVRQIYTSHGILGGQNTDLTFDYRLTPMRAANPMPSGSDANGYPFTVTGTTEKTIGPIRFTKAGTYEYEIRHVSAARSGVTYSQKVYRLEIIVDSNLDTITIIHNENGSKAAGMLYEHVFRPLPSDPGVMVDPPIVKTVFGNPATAGVFTFQLKAENPASPMPQGSVNGVKTVKITGSGRAEFGTWAYTAEGTYYYTASEVNSAVKGYVYDIAVYKITDTVRAVNGQLVVSRVVTNHANQNVSSFSFINTYKSTGATPPPDGKPDGPGGSGGSGGGSGGGGGGSGPKTGDESQTTLYAILFCVAGVTAMISAGVLLAGRRRGKETNDDNS